MVLPSLKQIFRLTGAEIKDPIFVVHSTHFSLPLDPPQSMMLLLSRMDLFLKKCSSAETFRQEIMPLLYTALELPVPHVQEQALKAVNAVLEKLEFSSIKSVGDETIFATDLSNITIICFYVGATS